MKNVLKILVLLGCLVSLNLSCEEKDEVGQEIHFETLDDLTVCESGCYIKDKYYENSQVVINNQKEYELVYECSNQVNLPEIDFENYILLAGSIASGVICPEIVEQTVLKFEDRIVYKILFNDKYGYTALGTGYYHALIPKKHENYEIEFKITQEN